MAGLTNVTKTASNADATSVCRAKNIEGKTIARRASDAKRKALKRANETISETVARRASDAQRKASKRVNETEIDAVARRASHAETMSERRANETVFETVARRASNVRSMSERRANETVSEIVARRASNVRSMSERRAAETDDQRRARLAQDAERRRNLPEEQHREAINAEMQRQLARAMRTYCVAINEFVNDDDVPEYYIGCMDTICQFCNSKNFKLEKPSDGKFSNCCHKGKVVLPPLNPVPDVLKDLITGSEEASKNFKQNIRSYNSALAFASMGAQDQTPQPQGSRGPYVYRIHGGLYHRTAAIHPDDGQAPRYAQLYVLDSSEANEHRMNRNSACMTDVMERLDTMLRECNPYAHAYRMMRELELEEETVAQAEGRQISPVGMFIQLDKSDDQRRYNAPKSNEIAMVFRNVDGEPPFNRDIRVYQKNPIGQPFENISILNPNLDPMTYPLLFPTGEPGWKEKLFTPGQNRAVTHLQFYQFRLAIRDEFNLLLRSGKLTQQYIVDAYAKTEANRLNYIKTHQKELKAETYAGITDHLNDVAASEGIAPGKVIILPSSFHGSPRAYQQNYQDAMAIIAKHGKPDLFVTFTCNPKWTEISENLEPGQRAEDRPDLVSRVFKLKLKELMHDICEKHVLGKHVAKIYVIEFQKRGLPHAHILVVLRAEDKIRDKETIDGIVCAEIPDPNTNPRLFEIVKKNMVHGPCGTHNPHSPCMDGNKCTKDFPKAFSDETQNNVNGYPVYRRRDTGTQFYAGTRPVDNRWLVPYNRWLLLKYNAHINVEICSSVKSVKYLFKYVYKGHDCANIVFRHGTDNGARIEWDEVASYLDARYLSPPEAIWRIRSYPMHEQSHAIIRLAVHCPNMQMVYFQEGQEVQAAAAAALRETTLTAWFKLNAQDESARQYLYPEIPYHYVFNPKEGWKNRQRDMKIVSRMYSVSPADMERFHLRLLLLHVRGARSFDELKTVDGTVCQSFQEAARMLNLLRDDIEWDKCLSEASTFQMPRQLRQLFAFICVFGYPSDPLNLWLKHKDHLCEDFLRDCNVTVSEQKALKAIQDTLILQGKRCSDFNLPDPPLNIQEHFDDIFDIENERSEGEENLSKLNDEQRHAFDEVMKAVENEQSEKRCFFIDGPGGSGKTFLYNALMSVLRGDGHTVLPVAWTGIAATLLKGGRTVHSRFKLTVPIVDNSTSGMRANSRDAGVIRKAKLIIWDEATMAPCYALNAVDLLLKDIMNNRTRPFGGKAILLGGDFRQCLPVVKHGSRTAIVGTSIKSSHTWRHFTQLKLSTNMRALPEEKDFSDWLLKLGNGHLTNDANLGEDIVDVTDFEIDESIITEVFGCRITEQNLEEASRRAILCPKNEDSLKLNNDALSLLVGEKKVYYSVDSVTVNCDGESSEDELRNYPLEYLHSLTPSGMPSHKLILKKGAIIMLLRNLNTRQGLCNGTRLVVRDLSDNVIHAEIIAGSFKGEHVLIPRIELAPSDTDLPFVLRRRQFPIRLAYCITINKSQGQTFEKVGIYLPDCVFSHGQMYVACSRAKKKSDVSIKMFYSERQGFLCKEKDKRNRVYTRNVVFREIFQ